MIVLFSGSLESSSNPNHQNIEKTYDDHLSVFSETIETIVGL